MADIVMTQIQGTTHHFRALIAVDPGNLEPTIDLKNIFKPNGAPGKVVEAILADPHLESIIEAEFEAQTTSVKNCIFKPGSFNAAALTIALLITTTSPIVEPDALEIKFEFLHSGPR